MSSSTTQSSDICDALVNAARNPWIGATIALATTTFILVVLLTRPSILWFLFYSNQGIITCILFAQYSKTISQTIRALRSKPLPVVMNPSPQRTMASGHVNTLMTQHGDSQDTDYLPPTIVTDQNRASLYETGDLSFSTTATAPDDEWADIRVTGAYRSRRMTHHERPSLPAPIEPDDDDIKIPSRQGQKERDYKSSGYTNIQNAAKPAKR